ncbi:hypothetical protein Mgra_00006457 [Meloidogyne graminicola]|uniref:Uncharacterized protein n=1 Tax=Meloidogyne graminicola TaxID=189291 RepID=A0A8S9ZL86_9BILA|nr:hypothetical protein Mgra_00006457 [Meloidogyne graminicola]
MRRRLLLSAGSTPVLIYKGAQPWAPLGQAKAFAGERGRRKFIHPPHAAILDDFEGSGEEPEMSHSNDYEVPEHDENSDLHESLRQPLKRLSDRQLSVLLKQIRGQRRKQQENEAATDENIKEEQSRKSMLTELHSLLRSPLNGEKLRRPKLLTNINIIPKEWNIYPPKQINEDINKEEIVNNLNKINETVGNVIIKQNEENEINLLPEVSIDNITRLELFMLLSLIKENLKEENEHKSIENTTTEITTKTEASKTITEEASTVEIVSKEKTISEDRLKEKDMADNAEFKRTTEQIKIASKTTKMPNILSSSTDNLLHSAEIAPIDNLVKLETNKVKEKEEKTQSKQQKSINKQKQSKQTTKTTFESKKSTNKDEQRITRLTAHWRVVEQKIANEMNDAIKNSSKIIAEAEKQQKLIKGKKGNSITFASKTFNPTENVENDNKKEEFEDFKTAQFSALSTQLKQIRQRYEALKRQYLAKLKWLKSKKEGREKNEKGVKRLDRMKAAGAPTFLNAAELDLEKVGMRRNKAELNSTIEENKNQNDTIINQPNIDNNKTENEEHRVIESELEELKHEEEFAKKSFLAIKN